MEADSCFAYQWEISKTDFMSDIPKQSSNFTTADHQTSITWRITTRPKENLENDYFERDFYLTYVAGAYEKYMNEFEVKLIAFNGDGITMRTYECSIEN